MGKVSSTPFGNSLLVNAFLLFTFYLLDPGGGFFKGGDNGGKTNKITLKNT